MKKSLNLLRFAPLALFLSLMTFFPQQGKSCIDPPDPQTIVTVTVNYSDDLEEIAIVLGNLKFMDEEPNVVCSCAFGSYTSFYSELEYVAFVYSGTNDLYPNFEPWTSPDEADAAWSSTAPGYSGWDGFIASVVNDGLGPNDDVELIIRASIPAGYFIQVSDLDTMLLQSALGTDAWDPVAQDLLADHQGIRGLGSNTDITLNEVSDDYFTNLDNDIVLSISTLKKNDLSFDIQPNPNNGSFQLNYQMTQTGNISINLRDITGQLVYSKPIGGQQQGGQSVFMDLPKGLLHNGIYIIEIISDVERGYQKILIAN